MALSPIAFIAPNLRDYPTWWLKAYGPGTTTPKTMALDSAGATTVAKLQLNADGFLESSGGDLVIPYIDGAYDLWLFPTKAEADANDTSNAKKVADDINALNLSIINDLSQAYDFANIAAFKGFSTVFPDGKQIRLLDRFATYTKASGTGSGNNTTIIDSTTVSQHMTFNDVNGGLVNVRQMGVVGDSTDGTDGTDDTEGLRAALKFPSVRGLRGFICRTTEMIIISNECQFNGMGMTILGQTTSDAAPWLSLRHDNINISFTKFGNGVLTGVPITIGDYASPDTIVKNIGIHTNKFNVGDMPTNRGIITAVGKVFELDVSNKNRFQTGADLSGKNIACVFMLLSTATVNEETAMSWDIDKNTCLAIPYLFNNFSNAFASGVNINNNTIRNAEDSLRTYHVYNCKIAGNKFIDCTGLLYIWQRSDFNDNLMQRCGNGVAAVKFETPSSTNISNNNIRNSVGVGAVLDGGNAATTFSNNNIWKSSKAGLIIDSNFSFGGQVAGLAVSGGRITDNFGAAIELKVTSTLRNMSIEGVYMSGNGKANATQVAAIEVDTTGNNDINELTIKNNTIRNNDVAIGTQDANTKWALRFSGGTAFSSTYVFSNNYTYTDEVVVDSRTGGGGDGTITQNLVQSLTPPTARGVSWFGNYNKLLTQFNFRSNPGSPVGSLIPLFLGEEVYDRGGAEDWYKGVGSLSGPWTNADWKLMT